MGRKKQYWTDLISSQVCDAASEGCVAALRHCDIFQLTDELWRNAEANWEKIHNTKIRLLVWIN